MPTRHSTVDIAVDGQHIDGTLVAASHAVPGVLLVHGWDGSQAQYLARAHEIAALGCVCLTFDLRGHARHASQRQSVSREDNLRDLLAAYDVLVAPSHRRPASRSPSSAAATAATWRPSRPRCARCAGWHCARRRCTATRSGTCPRGRSAAADLARTASRSCRRPSNRALHGLLRVQRRRADRRIGARQDRAAPGDRKLPRRPQAREVGHLPRASATPTMRCRPKPAGRRTACCWCRG